MICCFCSKYVENKKQAVGWMPTFYSNQDEYEGPVCIECTAQFLQIASDGELELKKDTPVPQLAILLRAHPNLQV